MENTPFDAAADAVESRELVLERVGVRRGHNSQNRSRAEQKLVVAHRTRCGIMRIRIRRSRVSLQKPVRLRTELLLSPFAVLRQISNRRAACEGSFVGIRACD